jgi:hypothetical protein
MTWLRATRALGYGLLAMAIAWIALAQGVSTTTVQGTVYLANGKPGAGTVQLSWPAFTTSNGLAVAAGRLTATIGADGFVSVNLTPNLGATPAGLFYTAVYHMSDGTTSTEYWVVPAAAQATIASVRAQVMPAAQAVQAASKAYVDQAILSLASGSLTPVGGTLTGPLYLSGDPTQSLQAADKHYVDATFAQAMPLAGGAATGPLTATQLGAAWQVDQFAGVDFGAKLQACVSGLSTTYGGTCDARNFSGTLAMASSVTIATANTTVLLPCATVATVQQIVATAATGTGAVSLQPLVEGTRSGVVYPINPANQYALRIRVNCSEIERDSPFYRSWGDNGQLTAGGQINSLPASLLFEIQEVVDGVASMPVVLYDGTVSALPDACWVAAVSSLYMVGSMRSLRLTSLGTGWVRTAPVGGTYSSRRLGITAEGGECYVSRSGELVFNSGFEPPVGMGIQVSYRMTGRAAGRSVNEASQAALAAAGLPQVCSWMGTVTEPAARSSQDCRNAASVMAQAAAGVSSAWVGTYKSTNVNLAADVWPGDALQLNEPSAGVNAQVVIRSVKLSYTNSVPDVMEYTIGFANEWADDLAIKTSSTVPADAQVPVVADPSFAANLSGLSVTSTSGNTVTVNTGDVAASGGGFEVRRRDGGFRPGEDTDLVMRASTSMLTFTRETADEQFYFRAFDGSMPPNYSEFSAALIFNLPLAS